MNGRAYDYQLGRFLSVDPFIQGTSSDAINPYSYIGNNPLSGTDPTGYLSCTDTEEKACSASDYDENGVHEHTDINGNTKTFVVGDAGETVSASNGEETRTTTIENRGGFDTSKAGDQKDSWRNKINLYSTSGQDTTEAAAHLDDLYSKGEFKDNLNSANEKFGKIDVDITDDNRIGDIEVTTAGTAKILISIKATRGYHGSSGEVFRLENEISRLPTTASDAEFNAIWDKIDAIDADVGPQKFSFKRVMFHELAHLVLMPKPSRNNMRTQLEWMGKSHDDQVINMTNKFMNEHYNENIRVGGHSSTGYGSEYRID
jgi:hypothetical protein